MVAIKINVNKQMDGYTFSIGPTIRELIKDLFPNACPANFIFVGFDTNSGFEVCYNQLENYIYPALLGVGSQVELKKKLTKSFSLTAPPVTCCIHTKWLHEEELSSLFSKGWTPNCDVRVSNPWLECGYSRGRHR